MQCSSEFRLSSTISGAPLIRIPSCSTSSFSHTGMQSAAERFFKRLLKDLRYEPRVIVTAMAWKRRSNIVGFLRKAAQGLEERKQII